jgi:hypothetical protein
LQKAEWFYLRAEERFFGAAKYVKECLLLKRLKNNVVKHKKRHEKIYIISRTLFNFVSLY